MKKAKLFFVVISVAMSFMACETENNVSVKNDVMGFLLLPLNQASQNLVPVDWSEIDALQYIRFDDGLQDIYDLENGWSSYGDVAYKTETCLFFRERNYDATNISCNGFSLRRITNGITRGFCYGWDKNSGPLNQEIIWQFERDGRIVMDTLSSLSRFGRISFSSGDYIDLNANQTDVFWQNSDVGDVVVTVSINYFDVQRMRAKEPKTFSIIVPNSGSFSITKNLLEQEFGNDFQVDAGNLSVLLFKVKYKLKNYGTNNDKVLLSAVTMSGFASILCE